MKRHIIILVCIIFAHCGDQPAKTRSNPPKFDYSTPDKLVKSIWTYRIWRDTSATADNSTIEEFYSQETAGRIKSRNERRRLRSKESHPWQDNQITRVSIESDSRAIVDARINSKIRDADPDNFNDIIYVLSRENNQWKLSEQWHVCSICNGTGKQRDWKSLGGGMIECDYCEGRGKMSMLAGDY